MTRTRPDSAGPADPSPGPSAEPVLRLDRDERGGVSVALGGHPQSYVDLEDPGLLVFEYVQHLALVLDALPAGRLAVTHVGGAGLTVPRYVEHTRPGSPQVVLEPDAAGTERVRRELPLPRGHRIRVRPVSGEHGIGQLRDGTADAVVLDAYDSAGQVPARLVGSAWFTEAARVLAPDGVLLANLADEPGLRFVARVVATLAPLLPEQAMLAATDVLKGKRYGNVVLVASRVPLDRLDLPRRAARTTFPGACRAGVTLARATAGAVPFDARGHPSPAPPDPGRWRLR